LLPALSLLHHHRRATHPRVAVSVSRSRSFPCSPPPPAAASLVPPARCRRACIGPPSFFHRLHRPWARSIVIMEVIQILDLLSSSGPSTMPAWPATHPNARP